MAHRILSLTTQADYDNKDVAGKVVLASGPLAGVMNEAVWKRGALGIVAFTTSRVPSYPDQLPWMRIPVENEDKTKAGTTASCRSTTWRPILTRRRKRASSR